MIYTRSFVAKTVIWIDENFWNYIGKPLFIVTVVYLLALTLITVWKSDQSTHAAYQKENKQLRERIERSERHGAH